MSFAIIETGGKQYKVSASKILKVEKLNISKGKKVEFKKVLLVNDDKTTEVGSPTISGAMVEGLLLDNIKDKKIIVFKKRRRQNYRLTQGHRQYLTVLKIESINHGEKKSIVKQAAKNTKIDKEDKIVKKSEKKIIKKEAVAKKTTSKVTKKQSTVKKKEKK